MPTYFEMLKKTDWNALLEGPHRDMIKDGGVFLIIAAIVLVIGLFWMLLGLLARQRRRLGQGIGWGFLGALIGWGASYWGYHQAAKLAKEASPSDADVALVGSKISYAAFAPTGVFVAMIVLAMLLRVVVKDRTVTTSEEG